jgi:hypothetical protein
MIRYTLKCKNDHGFESWFQSSDSFDQLVDRLLIVCPECGATDVAKSLMAPLVTTGRKSIAAPEPQQALTNAPDPKVVEAIRTLRAHVESNSDYVGNRFAAEARSMHEGETPHRAIYGEARPDEARKLIEDGVPALPLPFIPRQKTN